jgi:hypothetical protein
VLDFVDFLTSARRPGYRFSLITRSARARDLPPTRSRRQKRFVQRKILYIKCIYFYFFSLFQGAAAAYEIGSNVSYYYYTTGFVRTSCYATLTPHATLRLHGRTALHKFAMPSFTYRYTITSINVQTARTMQITVILAVSYL